MPMAHACIPARSGAYPKESLLLAIDTSNVRFEVTGFPRPATDYNPETRERTPKVDKRSGQPIEISSNPVDQVEHDHPAT